MAETEPEFPHEGILWRPWDEDTLALIAERNRPVLLFVADSDPAVYPFLRDVFTAMPREPKLRSLLDEFFTAVLAKTGAVPSPLQELGAGTSFHIAVLSPQGLTPLVVIDPKAGPPHEIAGQIARILERLEAVWR